MRRDLRTQRIHIRRKFPQRSLADGKGKELFHRRSHHIVPGVRSVHMGFERRRYDIAPVQYQKL